MTRSIAETYAARGVVVVGIGADGWDGLADQARHALRGAGTVIGSPRQLDLLPVWLGARRVEWRSPLRGSIAALVEEYADSGLAVLASGDPLVHGIGRTLVEELGVDRLHFLPHPSSVSLACARLGWPVEDVTVVNVVGRGLDELPGRLRPGARLLVLSAGRDTPAAVAALLVERGFGESRLVVLGDLGSARESRVAGTAASWGEAPVPGLNVVAVQCEGPAVRTPPAIDEDPWFAGTEFWAAPEVRAVALAMLDQGPGEILWEVGAGTGAASIAWQRRDPTGQAIAIEPEDALAVLMRSSAQRSGVPCPRHVSGAAPQALAGLPTPDAILVGGGIATIGVLSACWRALRVGGRLVAASTTVEGAALLSRYARAMGGRLRRVEVAVPDAEPGATRWQGGNPIVLWGLVKGPDDDRVMPDLRGADTP